MSDHDEHGHREGADDPDFFEPAGWEERYAGDERVWSGHPNPQLVAEAARLLPGSALDVGCGEGGDVVHLARLGWRVTGADFSARGLDRAARHADEAGVAERTDWWQVDARGFDPDGRTWDLVTTHYLHPAEGGMPDIVTRLAAAVAPGGHLLVVGHAPSDAFTQLSRAHRGAMFHADDLVGVLPDEFEVIVAEDRPRRHEHDGVVREVGDATLLARRRPPSGVEQARA